MLTRQKEDLINRLSRPIFKRGTVNVNIHRYITDVDGNILTGGGIPVIMRQNYPVFLLGNFDRLGGYNIGVKTIKQPTGLTLLMTYVQGVNLPALFATGFNEVQAYFRKGDIITVWVDDFNNPNYFAFIQQTVQNGGLASILSNPDHEKLMVENVSYQCDNIPQVNTSWQIVWLDNFGNFKNNPLNVGSLNRSPYFKLTDFIDLNISFELSAYMGLNFLMLYDSETINVNFQLNS